MRFPITTQNKPGKVPVVYVKAKVAKSRSRQKGCEVLVPVSLSQRFPASDKAQVWASQPLGSERAIEINGRVFKGAGQRDDEVTYFARTVGTPGSGLHFIKPFDINVYEEASNTQFMLGGSPFSPLDYEFRKAAAIQRIFKIMGLDSKGLVSPLNNMSFKSFLLLMKLAVFR